MFCKNCGTKILDDSVFCQKCGSKINYDTVEQGQKESLVEVSDTEEMIVQEQPKEVINQVQEMPETSFENEEKPKKKRFKKVLFILGAVVLIFVMIVLVDEIFFRRGNSDIASVAAHRQFLNSQGLGGNYEEVIDKYLISANWKARVNENGSDYVDISGTIKGTNRKLDISIEVKPHPDMQEMLWIGPKSVVLEGDKSREGVEATRFLSGMFTAYEKGYEDLSEIIAMLDENLTPDDVKLSETYTNQEEGFSFKYPKTWIRISEEDLYILSLHIKSERNYLTGFRNEIAGILPNVVVVVSKLDEKESNVDFVYDNEGLLTLLPSNFGIDESAMMIRNGMEIRMVGYNTYNKFKLRSYLYSDGFTTYVVDFISEAKNEPRYDKIFNSVAEAVMDSYHLIY